MSKKEIFEYFYTYSANLGVKSIVLVMLAAMVYVVLDGIIGRCNKGIG